MFNPDISLCWFSEKTNNSLNLAIDYHNKLACVFKDSGVRGVQVVNKKEILSCLCNLRLEGFSIKNDTGDKINLPLGESI